MTQDAKLRALSIFDGYLDSSEAARARLREDLRQRDPELLAALQALLDADGESSTLDIAPAELLAQARPPESTQPAQPDPRIGSRLGAWRIDGVIAEGGMGTVYAAQRADGQYEQRAALKCVRTTLASAELLQAFLVERNHLARLEHPGIATLLDGGVGEDGQPWFAMRHVDGVAVDAWCDGRDASVRERVDVLIQICEALSYAHAQGIVHRDIKPSNVLVTHDGRAHLVDFGISSHFAESNGDGKPRGHIAITPDYAAPEAREYGLHAPAADLYALGVLTYRLLCAQWPLPLHSLRDLIPVAISQPMAMDALLADASKDIALRRGLSDIAALRRELAGDLSAIALKAVAPRPEDRYASVAEFAQDLRRWREHRPIAIRPGNWWSRARKWRRRNPAAAWLGTALMLAVVVGLSLSLWQQRRTAREAAATQAVSRLFASTLGTATLAGLGSSPFSSRALLEKTERELAALPLDDQPALRARSLATLARSYAVMGDYRNAERLTAQAHGLLERARLDDALVIGARIAILNIQRDYTQAQDLANRQLQALTGRDDESTRRARIAYTAELAKSQWGLGETRKAMLTADSVVEQTRSLGAGHEELLAEALLLRSNFLGRMMRARQAEADVRSAIQLARPYNPVLADDGLNQLTTFVSQRGSPELLRIAEELLRNRRQTLGENHPKTASARIRLALARYPKPSKVEVAKALASLEAAFGRDHPDYASALSASSWALADDPRQSIDMLKQALAILQRTVGPQASMTSAAKGNLGKDLTQLPDSLRTDADVREGIVLLQQTVQERERMSLPAVSDRTQLIQALLRFGDARQLAQAQALQTLNRRDALRYYNPGDEVIERIDHTGDRLLFRQGLREQADANFARKIEANRAFMRSVGTDLSSSEQWRVGMLSQSLTLRAMHAFEQCRKSQASAFLSEALEFDQRTLGADDSVTRSARNYLQQLREYGRMADEGGSPLIPADELEELNRKAQFCASGPSR